MKKILLFIMLIMAICQTMNAQIQDVVTFSINDIEKDTIGDYLKLSMLDGSTKTWPMPGAKWTYCLFTELGDCYATETWQVTGDSVSETRKYSKIQPVDSCGIVIPNSGKMLVTRYSNDTVYRLVNGREYVYFVFNLNVGDLFTTFRSAGWGINGVLNYGNDSTCSSLKPLLVTQKREIELGGTALNEYILKDTLFTALYGLEGRNWVIVDRIGPIGTYPLIDLKEIGFFDSGTGDCIYAICNQYVELSAYHDDNFEQVWFDCHPTSVAENGLNENLIIYPNPTKDIIHIEGGRIVIIQVYNAFGQIVKTVWHSNEVNVENLPKGIFTLMITDDNNTTQRLKLIKE